MKTVLLIAVALTGVFYIAALRYKWAMCPFTIMAVVDMALACIAGEIL